MASAILNAQIATKLISDRLFKSVGLAVAKWPHCEVKDKNQDACANKADKSYHGIGSKGMDGQQDQPSACQYAFPVRCPLVTIRGLGKWVIENLFDTLGSCLLTIWNDPCKKTRKRECTSYQKCLG